jgi:aspartate racemase
MKTIGLIGGLSWESSAEYYRILNLEVNKRLGGKHSARLQFYSFDFDEIDKNIKAGNFDAIGDRLTEEAVKLEKAGAELLVLGANTAHRWVDQIEEQIQIPLIHIGDAIGKAIQESGLNNILLLGTKFTMEWDFMIGKLTQEYKLNIVVPDAESRMEVHNIIYNELIKGQFLESSELKIKNLINCFNNIEGVILGCTELPLLVKEEDFKLKLFDTTELHSMAIVDFALQ